MAGVRKITTLEVLNVKALSCLVPRLRALGVAACVIGSAGQVAAQPTRVVLPDDTPRLAVLTFRSNDKVAGVQTANSLRDRLTKDYDIKKLYVVAKEMQDNVLKASGFNPDSALEPITAGQLAQRMRAEEYIDGTVTKAGQDQYKIDARLVLARDRDMVQPLPSGEGKIGDATSTISKSVVEARKQLPSIRQCENALRANNVAEALTAAHAAITAYPNSTLGRVCLANALVAQKAKPDSILAVTGKVFEFDPHNKKALSISAQAYKDAGNIDKAVETWTRMVAEDPKNTRFVTDIVGNIAASGRAGVAKPIITKIAEDNPGDPDLTRLKWLILYTTNSWKEAAVTGEELAKLDTAQVDSTFIIRIAKAYAADSQPQKAAEWTSKGVAKYPKSAALWVANANALVAAGQTQKARDAAAQAVALDPKAEHAYLIKARAESDLDMPDSAVASLQNAAKNGEDTTIVGKTLLVLGNKAMKAANGTKNRADFQKAMNIIQQADHYSPSPAGKFLLGYTAFQLGDGAMREAATSKNCDLSKLAQDSFNTATINIPAGGSTSPDAAKQLMAALQQYAPVVESQVKKFCK